MREPKLRLRAIARLTAVFLTFVLSSGTLKAQRLISPVDLEQVLDTVTGVTNINSDMFDCPIAGGKLMAATYDSAGYVCIRIWHSSGRGGILSAPPVLGSKADIVIADDSLSNGGAYFVMATYVRNGRVEMARFRITNIGRTTFRIASRGYIVLSPSGVRVRSPRLDAWPDTSATIGGHPIYKRFICTWAERDLVVAMEGSVRFSRASDLRRHSIGVIDTPFACPDVTAIRDISTGHYLAGFVFKNSSGLNYVEKNLSTGNQSAPMVLSTNSQIHHEPRLEAMNYYDPSSASAKWQVVSSEYNSSTDKWDIYSKNNLTAYGCTEAIGSMNNAYTPTVSAGMGTLGSGLFIGNKNYIIGWKQDSTANFYSSYINALTGDREKTVEARYHIDTSYYQDVVTLYDTLKFVNTVYITNSYPVYITNTNYTYIKDTIYEYKTARGRGLQNANYRSALARGKKPVKFSNGRNAIIDTIGIITVIDTVGTYTATDTTDVQFVDSLSIIARDSVFTAMNIINTPYTVDLINFYQVNSSSISGNHPIAISSATNTGNGVLAIWFDGSYIKYKITENRSGYKGDPNEPDETEAGPFSEKLERLAYNNNNNSIRLYPNPAHDVINLEGCTGMNYHITDVVGRVLQSGLIQNNRIEIDGLNVGAYLLTVNLNAGAIGTVRFVKE